MEKMEPSNQKDTFDLFEDLQEIFINFSLTFPDWVQDYSPEFLELTFSDQYFKLVAAYNAYKENKQTAIKDHTFFQYLQEQKKDDFKQLVSFMECFKHPLQKYASNNPKYQETKNFANKD